MDWKSLLTNQFTLGFGLGFIFLCMSIWNHFKTKREFRRFRKHLSDKLELDAASLEGLKKDKDTLLKENENLRVRAGMMGEKPDQKILRDLEILTRAEKRMVLRAPGFAPAWEAAKSEASEEIAQEEMGKSSPKRLFSRLFGNAALKLLDSAAAGSNDTSAATSNTTPAEPTTAGTAFAETTKNS
jgi:hypothetical protein